MTDWNQDYGKIFNVLQIFNDRHRPILLVFCEINCWLSDLSTVDPGYKKLAYKKYQLIVNSYLGTDCQFHSFFFKIRIYESSIIRNTNSRSPDVDYIQDPL